MADPADGDFLSRWSRRKRGEHPEQAPAEPIDDNVPSEVDGDPEVVAQLPDIDGMDDASDFSMFLKAGVPEALRRRALRKLWRINPVLANLDGLNDYDEDYSMMSALGQGMKTLYKVGKGFASDESDAMPEEGGAEEKVADDAPPSELSLPSKSESQTAALNQEPDHAEPRVREPVKPTCNPKGAASRRRWGTSKTSS